MRVAFCDFFRAVTDDFPDLVNRNALPKQVRHDAVAKSWMRCLSWTNSRWEELTRECSLRLGTADFRLERRWMRRSEAVWAIVFTCVEQLGMGSGIGRLNAPAS